MLSGQKEASWARALLVIDVLLAPVSFALAYFFKEALLHSFNSTVFVTHGYGQSDWILYVIALIFPLALSINGFYRNTLYQGFGKTLSIMLKSAAAVSLLLLFGTLVLKLPIENRSQLLPGLFVYPLMILLRWALWRYVLAKRQNFKGSAEPVIAIGSPERLARLYASLGELRLHAVTIVAEFELKSDSQLQAITESMDRHSVSKVFVDAQSSDFSRLPELVSICELQGIELWMNSDFLPTQLSSPKVDYIGDTPMIVVRNTPQHDLELYCKYAFDRVFALLAILLSLPLWIVAAIGIYLSDRGPIFFKQQRSGLYGRPFYMWKFRSMYVDAEARLEEVKRTVGNNMSGPVFKLDKDPRVFGFGEFLRRTSIDELPQFLNVLFGHMSVVGPRPLPVYEVKAFANLADRRRLSVKPGLTCYWQIEGRNQITSFEDWVKLDCKYIDNWSFWLDLKLIALTIPAVLLRRGAK